MTKEEAKKFGLQLLHGIMERNESYPVYANNVKQAIDALSEESGSSEIPNALEEASSKFATHTASNGVSIEFLYEKLSFQEGAKWQREQDRLEIANIKAKLWQDGFDDCKEQMMKEAMEGTMYEQPDGTTFLDCQSSFPAGMFNHEEKVRVIIVKED